MRTRHGGKMRAAAPETDPGHELHSSRTTLVSHYRRALRAYVGHRDDVRLQSAYELGCLALRSGMGVFDLARLHEKALGKAASGRGSREHAAQRVRAAETFLLEALSPFEAARRGLPEAYVRLGQLNETLERRNDELAAINGRQHRMQEALRAGRRRFFKLSHQARDMKEDLRQHSAKLDIALEEERKRVSRELHDEIGQALAAVNVGLAILKKQAGRDRSFQRRVASTQALLEQSMESVHRFARGLRPKMLDLFGPYEAIRSYAAAFAERTGVIATIAPKVNLAGLDNEQEIVLFRVAQESITNISKHAQATRIDIRFRRLPQQVCMEIQDNGRSFSVADKLGKGRGKRLGLLGMQERVRLVHGDFTIESAAGRGTKVRVQFPVAPINGCSVNGNGNGDRPHAPATGLLVVPKTIL